MRKNKLFNYLVAPFLIFALICSFSFSALAVEDSNVETAISNIKGTISKLNINIAQGKISKTNLETLASQLYQLETAVKATGTAPSSKVVEILNSAEDVGKKANSSEILAAVAVVRESLGITAVETTSTIENTKANLTFDDVKEGQWFYKSIMDMVGRGLLNGTVAPVNGVGHFDAEGSMTKSAYITVAVRIAYQSEMDAMPKGDYWWSNAYDLALKHGIITINDKGMTRTESDMNKAITREEMAMILVRTAHIKGMSESEWVYGSQIPDYILIDGYYKDYVRECYTMGLLNGVDSKGTFAPLGVLNRASACQSFYNLLHPEVLTKRTPQSPSSSVQAAVQVWKEGEVHTTPHEGDTVIKADGTKVVLKNNLIGTIEGKEYYQLGYGQGVDIYTGMRYDGVSSDTLVVEGDIVSFISYRCMWKDKKITGEMYPADVWNIIQACTDPTGKFKGDYDGEVYNTWWKWNEKGALGPQWFWIGPHIK